MSEPLYEDPVVAEIRAIRAQMLAECGGDFQKLMEQVREHEERERASGRKVIPPPPAAPRMAQARPGGPGAAAPAAGRQQ